MTIKQARKSHNTQRFSDGSSVWELRISTSNPHDLWFWLVNKTTKMLISTNGGTVKRVYLGSKNVPASGLGFLEQLKHILF